MPKTMETLKAEAARLASELAAAEAVEASKRADVQRQRDAKLDAIAAQYLAEWQNILAALHVVGDEAGERRESALRELRLDDAIRADVEYLAARYARALAASRAEWAARRLGRDVPPMGSRDVTSTLLGDGAAIPLASAIIAAANAKAQDVLSSALVGAGLGHLTEDAIVEAAG